VREDSEVRGEDSDDSEQDDEADPCPEVDADTEDLAAAGEGAATEALAAVDSSIDGFSEEEHEVVATVRYRASYGDIEKNPIHSAADTFAECKVDRLSMQCIWQWVDEVIASQVNQRVNVQLASLSAELWHGKGTNKRDRPVKRLRRESLSTPVRGFAWTSTCTLPETLSPRLKASLRHPSAYRRCELVRQR
jgi:hypothetical protein